jgi:hypothetical protein
MTLRADRKETSIMADTRLKFSMGQLVATPSALATLNPDDVAAAVRRHANGDWGELDEHDRLVNESALTDGSRLFSAYRDRVGTKFWVITESDRSVTTVLLPEDY